MDAQEKKPLNFNLAHLLNITAVRQLIFLLGMSGSIALGIYLFFSIQAPNYRPLDYKVTQQNITAIVDAMEKAGIQYKINQEDGLLYVDGNRMQLARLKLAASGVAKDDSISFSYLNEQGNIGNSQFLENARYLRALESDLAKTISTLEGISNARVHIAVPPSNIFAEENQHPSASIVVSVAAGLLPDQEKIKAIVQIVASSVPGLDPKNVSITDQFGHFLSSAMDAGSIYNSDQLHYQNNLQNYYEKRIETMIVPILGDNKVNVRVQATIDFTQNEEANEQYDPNNKAVRSEQAIKESDGAASGAGGPPGSLSNTPTEGGAAQEKGPGAEAGGNNGRSESVKNYEVSKTITYKKSLAPKLTKLSAAVVIDNPTVVDPKTGKVTSKELDKATLDKIIGIVKATIGFDEKRGDQVTVVNSAFEGANKLPELAPTPFWQQLWFWDLAKKTVTIIAGLVILFLITRKLFHFVKMPALAGNSPHSLNNVSSPDGISPEVMKLKEEQINRLKELASKDPNRVSVIIKNWIEK